MESVNCQRPSIAAGQGDAVISDGAAPPARATLGAGVSVAAAVAVAAARSGGWAATSAGARATAVGGLLSAGGDDAFATGVPAAAAAGVGSGALWDCAGKAAPARRAPMPPVSAEAA